MSWMFTRGTLKAHFVKDGKAICGSGNRFEQPAYSLLGTENFCCKKCVHKLELMEDRGKEQ